MGLNVYDQAIANTKWGYYGKVSGKSIEHVTGCVYSQEPAAQMVAQVAVPKKGNRVLDLAAAPGCKTTHLLSYLDNTGLLVSNEISKKRSKILVENVERFGAQNVVVINESAENLAKVFPEFFDTIVFDGLCSGEGMFRKDPEAIQYWHKDYPLECANLQKSILDQSLAMPKPGGELIYSTCTWSQEENEGVVNWLLENYSYLQLLDIPKINGMVEGIDMPQAARMYPHYHKGEGQFVAKLKDTRSPQVTKPVKAQKSNLTREQLELWKAFEKNQLKEPLKGFLQTFGDHLYLLPDGLPSLKHLKIARNGLELGVFKKKRFEPSFALGLALNPEDVLEKITISEEDFSAYVSGNVVNLADSYPNGWYQVVIKGNGLGFAKIVGKTLKNSFPKGLRF
ncbi:NOL1/NOP2/sun family protein [Streptococcus ictaluri 707-05]|uniref:NOL1/NOP2/sun family protein n=1 Tax=Streptococcus ictaluri 707-05 TaxID=764299 RepID=G5K2V2_9STRE|nr:NOL1/NOP2/sun family protein [Streptococcus ictaluri 707-05]